MKSFLIKLTIAALVAPLAVSFNAQAKGDASSGESKTAVCAACHGADGNSPAPNFPKLASLGEKYLLNQLRAIKSKDRKIVEMTGLLDNFSDQDLADMAAYYNSKKIQLSGAKELSVQVNSGEKVDGLALGQRIYRAGNMESAVPACTGCHSPSGAGNSPAGFPRLGGQHAQYIEKQLNDFRLGHRTTDGDAKIMRQVAQYMSEAEIKAVANYIAGLH